MAASERLESMAKAPGGGDGSDARGDGTCGNDGGLVCREVLELEEEDDPGAPPARWDCIAGSMVVVSASMAACPPASRGVVGVLARSI